ncbi:MAG: pre-peptidase C-terminal domain-containing protein [Acidobacteria bacterium]|nr:pre-peptidase C-terminal domain-containing protein [Acidobacteriota bacterium]MBI3422024.1 pre-peptidase C-terminal domain-containing protein [Acidobacteriota bacterium]
MQKSLLRCCGSLPLRMCAAFAVSCFCLFLLDGRRAASQVQFDGTSAPTYARAPATDAARTSPDALEQGVPGKAQLELPSRRYGIAAESLTVSRRLAAFDPATERTYEPGVIGVARKVSLASADVNQGKLARRIKNDDGSELRILTIQSPGALEMFAHLTEFDLPAGEAVYVYGNAANSPVGGPYRGRGPVGQARGEKGAHGDFWTETAQGDTLIIEHYSPHGAPRGTFAIPEITHHFTAFLDAAKLESALSPEQTQPLSCHNDANCSPNPLNNAVGLISFMRDGKSALCSGTMLTTVNDPGSPYFLTANHCIATATQAATVQVTWQYRSSACNSGVAGTNFTITPRGTYLLRTRKAVDQTLLRVLNGAASGQVYAGWSTKEIGLTDFPNVFGLHHPRGSFLRRSNGGLVLNQFGCDATGLNEGYDILWGSGITEPGSSGSGLYFADSQALFGVLSCGIDFDSCSTKINSRYGRFRDFYPQIDTWVVLGDRGLPSPPIPPLSVNTPQVINDTLTSAMPSRVYGLGFFAKVFTFNGQAGQRVKLTLSSSAFDGYLYLIHGSKRTLLAEDDDSGGGPNAQIVFTLPDTGSYIIEVSTSILNQAGAFTLAAQQVCDLSLSKTDVFLPAKAGVAAALLNNPDRCAWTASSDSAWLRLRKTSGSDATESILADVDAFTSDTGARTGIIKLAGGPQLQVHQAHQCVAAPIQTGQVLSGSLSITDCRAPLTNDANEFPYTDLYTFSGTNGQRIAIEMDSTELTPRLRLLSPTGTLINQDAHGGRARIPYPQGFFTLTATGTSTIEASHNNGASALGAYKIRLLSDCNTLVTPTPDIILAAGTTINFTVAATTGCPWNAFSYASWIKINAGETGAGNGMVNVTIAPNAGPAREAILNIAGNAFTIQQRSGCKFTVDPQNRGFTAGGGGGSFNVTATDAECPWSITATAPSGMLLFGQTPGQKGNGTVQYAVKANTGAARTAQLLVGDINNGQVHFINQAAVAPNPLPTLAALAPNAALAGGERFTLTVTGDNLVADTVIRWNGRALTTTVTGRNTVTAEIAAADIANAGTARVTLFNPTPGGGESSASNFTINGPLANLSAASFTGKFAANGIVAVFGARLATRTVSATTTPLPTELGGTTVKLIDGARVERLAQLFFVSASQINYLVPAGTPAGPYTVLITSADGNTSTGVLTIETVAPGLFTANANGQGAPAAVLLRVLSNGAQRFEPAAELDRATNRFQPIPLVVNNPGEQVILVLFGTGIRGRSALSRVTANLDRERLPVDFAGAQGLAGLDQINLPLPARLAGAGETTLTLSVDGKLSNGVLINFR